MEENINQLQNSDLDVYQGYKATLDCRGGKLCLLIDICYRIIQSTLFGKILKKTKDYSQFAEEIVVTDYGNNKTYPIVSIDPHVTANSTFEKNGKQITYGEYFEKEYGKRIEDKNLPMIESYYIQK